MRNDVVIMKALGMKCGWTYIWWKVGLFIYICPYFKPWKYDGSGVRPWMNFNFRSRHKNIPAGFFLCLSHRNTFPLCIIFLMSFRFACLCLCSYATSPSWHTVSLPTSPLIELSVLSHAFSLSVSVSLSDLYPPEHVLEVDWPWPARQLCVVGLVPPQRRFG